MSRTYRKTSKYRKVAPSKLKRLNNQLYSHLKNGRGHINWLDWLNIKSDLEFPYMCYGKNPSHWNHQYSTVPRRAKERQLLSKLKNNPDLADNICFPDGKKPVIYYW